MCRYSFSWNGNNQLLPEHFPRFKHVAAIFCNLEYICCISWFRSEYNEVFIIRQDFHAETLKNSFGYEANRESYWLGFCKNIFWVNICSECWSFLKQPLKIDLREILTNCHPIETPIISWSINLSLVPA